MKFDEHGILVREAPRPEGDWWSNIGDACADTCRAIILGCNKLTTHPIVAFTDEWRGFLRHPQLRVKEGWDRESYTSDQLVPLIMAQLLVYSGWVRLNKFVHFGFIRGTWKIAQPMVYALIWRQWWLVNLLNHIQGWLLTWSFRWSDDKSEGIGFKSSEGKVQDYPTMICTWVFLNRIGHKSKLPRPVDECMRAIVKYRQDPRDFEPNAEWEIKLYADAIKAFGFKN